MTASHQLTGRNGAADARAADSDASNSPIVDLLKPTGKLARSNKPLIHGDGYRLSYRQLTSDVQRLVTFFRTQGLEHGDRVALISDHDPSSITLFFALLRCGVTTILLNPNGSAAELETLVEAADPALLFADREVLESVPDLRKQAPVLVIDPEQSRSRGLFRRRQNAADPAVFPALLAHHDRASKLPQHVPDDTPAYILFTSGTTSRPKGVVITHRSLFAQMQTFVNQYGLDADTRLLNVLPFYHTDGLTQGAVVSLVAGGTLIRPMRFRVERIAELVHCIYRHRVTHFVTVPSMLALIDQIADEVADAFQTLEFRFVISTAAYLDEGLWQRFENTFGVRVVNVYGLTETVCEACYCGPDQDSFKYGTVGRPVDCEARVLLADGSRASQGGPGELVIRGDNVMAGYFRMPEETEAVLRDGWFHTGDIAEIDAQGFVRIVGRKKSVIISGGYNIYPEDVTNVIRRMPAVLDAVTFGLPDATWGEKVVACVIPKAGAELSESTLAAHFLAQASREKLPREFHIMEEFPRGPAGKVVLEELKARVAEASAPDEAEAPTADSLRARFLTVTARAFKVGEETIGFESTPEEIETWDSLAHVEWLMALEKSFSIRFTPKDIMTIRSVGEAMSALESKRS